MVGGIDKPVASTDFGPGKLPEVISFSVPEGRFGILRVFAIGLAPTDVAITVLRRATSTGKLVPLWAEGQPYVNLPAEPTPIIIPIPGHYVVEIVVNSPAGRGAVRVYVEDIEHMQRIGVGSASGGGGTTAVTTTYPPWMATSGSTDPKPVSATMPFSAVENLDPWYKFDPSFFMPNYLPYQYAYAPMAFGRFWAEPVDAARPPGSPCFLMIPQTVGGTGQWEPVPYFKIYEMQVGINATAARMTDYSLLTFFFMFVLIAPGARFCHEYHKTTEQA